jgi:hypothetical protein
MICNTVDTMNAYISNRYPCTYNKKQKNPKYSTPVTVTFTYFFTKYSNIEKEKLN